MMTKTDAKTEIITMIVTMRKTDITIEIKSNGKITLIIAEKDQETGVIIIRNQQNIHLIKERKRNNYTHHNPQMALSNHHSQNSQI